MGETVTATFLFTDLVGSTALATSRSAPEAEALRQIHFGLLRDAVRASGGSEVKNLGDGLMVMFASPSRALACAVGMQQAIDRHNQRADVPLAIRVGISAGETTEEDGDYFGDPVTEAARLCAAADGGQILAAEVVSVLVGRHATHELSPAGPFELKGFAEPVPAREVVWEPDRQDALDETAVPLPGRLISGADALFAFFGRSGEFGVIGHSRKIAGAEARLRAVMIGGEPGMGKTTLAMQAARAAHQEGAAVLFGGCEEGLAAPYAPWIAALGHLVDHAPSAALERLRPPHAGALARLMPDRAHRLPEADTIVTDPDRDRLLLFEAVVALLSEASTERPVVVLLDDMHWADAGSLQLLRHLVATSSLLRVLIIVTYRDSEVTRTHALGALLADWHAEPRVTRLPLTGLADAEIAELIEAAAGHSLDAAGFGVAQALGRETGGNPFFVTELLRHLGESGAIVQDEQGRYVLVGDLDDLVLPGSVRDVIGRRVARLGDEGLRVLSVAAVIGRDFDLDLLAAVADADEDALLDLLDAGASASLVGEDRDTPGRYRFVHALIAHTLAQELSATRRQRLHLRIAQQLEAQGADAAVQARHWVAATQPTDTAKAIEYARRAGDDALAALAPDDAVGWYRQALELLDRGPDADPRARCRLLLAVGRAESAAGVPDFWAPIREACRIARGLGDRELLVDAALTRGFGSNPVEYADPERLELIDLALRAVGEHDSPERARLLAALSQELDPGDWEHRLECADEALAIARRVGDDASELAILVQTLGDIGALPDRLEQRRADLAAGIELAERARDVVALAWLHRIAILVALEAAHRDAAARHIAAERELAQSSGIAILEWGPLTSECLLMLLDGRLAECEATAAQAFAVNQLHGASAYGAQMWNIRNQQGRVNEVIELFEPIAAENPNLAVLRAALMLMYCEVGRLDEARALFARDAANAFADFPNGFLWSSSMARLADVAVALRDETAAAVLVDRLAPLVGQIAVNATSVVGAFDLFLARLLTVLGRYDEIDAHFAAALELHQRLGAVYLTARTQVDWAEALLERNRPGDPEQAATLASEADVVAASYGFAGLSRRIEPILR